MVNRGRPSLDCAPCRRRKLRCDLQRDICGQCRRAKLPCGGFRDPAELIVHDETSATKRKHSGGGEAPPNKMGREVEARYAFFAQYVFGLSRSLDMLAPLYQSASSHGHLAASVDAVSMAFLCTQESATPGLLRKANEQYLMAIRRLHSAMSSPDGMFSDATLQSVLLLDLYEKLVNNNPESSLSWMGHIKGALALANARGDSIIASHVSRRLATRLIVTLVISCGVSRIRVPDELLQLRERLGLHMRPGDPKWPVTGLSAEVINLLADVDGGTIDCEQILRRARVLEARFATTERMFPEDWAFVREAVEGDPKLPDGLHYDQYADHYITQVHNVMRSMRILLHTIIQKWSSVTEDKVAAATELLILNICSSAPQFVWPRGHVQRSGFSPLQRLQCHTLLWPLFLAGQVTRRADLTSWILDTMRVMADAGRMPKAKLVADTLERSPGTSYWDVYVMLGGYAFSA
ncbi:hypothetical protein GQ53DRAFT_635474 [Thozetella sp. PMI_491]|nr:hypothetical protein GQ53DRAFT_635474 [Thozetella sp. PMI_491]